MSQRHHGVQAIILHLILDLTQVCAANMQIKWGGG